MKAILPIAVATTVFGVVLHIIWWRIKRPKDDVMGLALSIGALPFIASFSFLLRDRTFESGISVADALLLGALVITHVLLTLGYMSFYTAAQAASPTVLIVLQSDSQTHGISRQEITEQLTDDLVSGDLVHAAIDEQFICVTDAGLTLGRRGQFLLIMGRLLRRMAGLSAPQG